MIFKRQWRSFDPQIRSLCVCTFLHRMGTMAFPFLAVYLAREQGLAPREIAFIVGVFGVGSLVAAPIGAWICDHWRADRMVSAAFLVMGVVVCLFPLIQGAPAIAAMTALWAVSNELFRGASLVILARLAPDDSRPVFALHRLAINLGMSVGPAVGGFLALSSYPLLFVVDGATSLVAGVVWAALANSMAVRPEGATEANSRPEAAPLWRPLTDSSFLILVAVLLPVSAVFFQYESSLPLALVSITGMNESHFGLLLTVNAVVVIALELPLNVWVRRWSLGASLSLGAVLIGAGFGLNAVVSSWVGFGVAVLVWTIGEIILFPAVMAYVSRLAGAQKGAYMGWFMVSFNAAAALGPWVGISVLAWQGPALLWGGCAAIGVVCGLLCLALPRASAEATV